MSTINTLLSAYQQTGQIETGRVGNAARATQIIALLDRTTDPAATDKLTGQQFSAKVISSDATGKTVLDVNGKPVTAQLSTTVKQGETIVLRFAESLVTGNAGNAASKQSPMIGIGKIELTAFLDDAPTQSKNLSTAVLSPGAQQLTALIGQLDQLPASSIALTKPALLPLAARSDITSDETKTDVSMNATQEISGLVVLSEHGVDGGKTAQQLNQAVSQSGLFYESHLVDMTMGRKTLAELQVEPQSAMIGGIDQGVAVASLPLVKAQLNIVEQGRIDTTIPLWGEQSASLQITQEPQQDEKGREYYTWRANLGVDLPQLGRVDATLSLRDQSIHLTIHDQSNTPRSVLEQGMDEFRAMLQAQGLHLSGVRFSDKQHQTI